MEVGLVKQIDIESEMQQSYLDYAMSVIIARALPDARDGFKPVHRRILHAMHAMGLRADTPFRKSARIVGEVLGKYHPHGDMAVYDAMARMAQPFATRYLLVEGQGNFGSIDGDPPAAMRYTEAKLTSLAMKIMADLGKDTVAFVDNFDGSLREPTVLPAAVPNMLINGATGIAVGMSTSIPPHNMGEVCDALVYMLENWKKIEEISTDQLMQFIKGPDFPTGGIILRGESETDTIAAAYGGGRGKLTVQARAHVEDMSRGRSRIIVTELPYQTNKTSLIERIADLARAGHLEGLSDLRDESDREGMRIVLELSKNADPEKVLADLYRRTPMQSTFSVIMLALVDGEPRILSLKQALRVFLDHRMEIVRRRSEYDMARAQERAHILTGLQTALANLDAVIQMIRTAKDAEAAHKRLMQRLKLSELQAQAILDMPLKRLSSLELHKIDQEFKTVSAQIKELEALLRSKAKMRNLIADELKELRDEYGDRRRTLIAQTTKGKRTKVLTASDLTPEKDVWITLTSKGHLARTSSARLPRMSGSGAPILVIGAKTRDTLYLFAEDGHAAALSVHTIPETDDPQQGKQLIGLTPFSTTTEVVAGVAIGSELLRAKADQAYLAFITKDGMVKKTDVTQLPGPSARTFEAVKIGKGDSLGWVTMTDGKADLILVSNECLAIRFKEADVRSMGLAAAGVNGMRLEGKGAHLVGAVSSGEGSELLMITTDGQAKRTSLSQFPKQGRYGKGVIAWRSGDPVELAGAAAGEEKDRAVVRFSRGTARSLRFGDAPKRARAAAGKQIFELDENVQVRSVAPTAGRSSQEPAAGIKKS
ncbi:MAG: DNA topoisomerase 4 subunit A [Anaerolineales bacterium]|nr:MAG: DNA topoisomerase 4 subunit A [Anaerolineales bacterium]